MTFALSISALSLCQAALIAVPARASPSPLASLRSRWWASVLPGSLVLVIGALAVAPGIAEGLTYLALVSVPLLAATAFAALVRGARGGLVLAVIPLFAIGWVERGSLTGEASALILSALACVALGSLLVAAAPREWVRRGIYLMATIDAILVAANLLQHPNAVLNQAAPAAGLPQLQTAAFGSAAMGFGDLFVAATLGALLVADRRPRRDAVAIAAVLALAFDLLFFFVGELPTTVPVAVTLAVLEAHRGRAVDSAPLTPQLGES
jgi:hypothetical protein